MSSIRPSSTRLASVLPSTATILQEAKPEQAQAQTQTQPAESVKNSAKSYGKADFDPVAQDITPTKNFYVNGIRTPENRANEARDLVSEKLGQEVELLYNPTENILKDGVETWKNLSGFETDISKQVENKFQESLDKGEKVKIFAHSQGSAITADALRNVAKAYAAEGKSPEEVKALMSQVEVVGFGGFADYKSFPEGVKVKLQRNDDDHVPQLATASLAVGDSFQAAKESPKDAKKWLKFGKATLGGLKTLGKTVVKNGAQAIESAYENRGELKRAFKEGEILDDLKQGNIPQAFGSENINRKQIESYFAKVCKTVQSDHLAVICDKQGKVVDGYISDYFKEQASV